MHHRRLGSQKSLCVCLSVYLTHNFNRVLLLPSITKLRNNFHLGIVSTKFLAHQKKGVIYYYYYNILLLNCEAMPWYCVSHSIASIKIRDISWNDIANKDFYKIKQPLGKNKFIAWVSKCSTYVNCETFF